MTQIQVIEWVVGVILTVVTVHSILTNRAKSKVDSIKTLWDRIDQLEKKLETEISKRDGIIEALQKRINMLESRLREYGIPLPLDDEEIKAKKPRGLARL